MWVSKRAEKFLAAQFNPPYSPFLTPLEADLRR